MSQLSFATTHNEYTHSPTTETEFKSPEGFSSLVALKEGFLSVYKEGNALSWLVFTFVGLLLSAGFATGSSMVASSASESHPGSVISLLGNGLSFLAILVALYFLFGLTQGYIRGTSFFSPRYGDLLMKDSKIILRSYAATISLAIITAFLIIPLIVLNLLIIVVGIPVPKEVNIGILILVAILFILIRVFFAYTIYAIIDSRMKVLDAFILSLKIVSHNFISSMMLFVLTTLLLVAPSVLISYIPASTLDGISNGALISLSVLAGIITFLIFPATQAAYIYAYRKSTFGPLTANKEEEEEISEENAILEEGSKSASKDVVNEAHAEKMK